TLQGSSLRWRPAPPLVGSSVWRPGSAGILPARGGDGRAGCPRSQGTPACQFLTKRRRRPTIGQQGTILREPAESPYKRSSVMTARFSPRRPLPVIRRARRTITVCSQIRRRHVLAFGGLAVLVAACGPSREAI